jgi:hypothetical protein
MRIPQDTTFKLVHEPLTCRVDCVAFVLGCGMLEVEEDNSAKVC